MDEAPKWFAFIFAFTCTVFAAHLGYSAWEARAAERWPSTPGIIRDTHVGPEQQCHDEGGGDITGDTRCERVYVGRVRYDYHVGGERYLGTRIALAETASETVEDARQLVARYRPGASVTVRYDPESPGDAVLELRPVNETLLLAFALGAFVFTIATISLFVAGRRDWRSA